MLFMLTRRRYRTEDIGFETKSLPGMYQVLEIHLLWIVVGLVTLSE